MRTRPPKREASKTQRIPSRVELSLRRDGEGIGGGGRCPMAGREGGRSERGGSERGGSERGGSGSRKWGETTRHVNKSRRHTRAGQWPDMGRRVIHGNTCRCPRAFRRISPNTHGHPRVTRLPTSSPHVVRLLPHAPTPPIRYTPSTTIDHHPSPLEGEQ